MELEETLQNNFNRQEHIYELGCMYDSRQCFYGKAQVKVSEDVVSSNHLLYSYGTLVAIYTEDKMSNLRQYKYLGKYSQTTTRHQKEFFRQKGLSLDEIKELFKKGFLEKEC